MNQSINQSIGKYANNCTVNLQCADGRLKRKEFLYCKLEIPRWMASPWVRVRANKTLHEELEEDGRRLRGGGGGGLLAVAPHVAAERLAHLEAEPADVAQVARGRRRWLLRGGLLGVVLRRRGHPEREAVAAPQVAGPVPAQRLERPEGAAARLADELAAAVPAARRRAPVPLVAAVLGGHAAAAEGQREGERHGAGAGVSRVLRHICTLTVSWGWNGTKLRACDRAQDVGREGERRTDDAGCMRASSNSEEEGRSLLLWMCWLQRVHAAFIWAEEEEDVLLSAHVHSTSGQTRERNSGWMERVVRARATRLVCLCRRRPYGTVWTAERERKGRGTFCDLSSRVLTRSRPVACVLASRRTAGPGRGGGGARKGPRNGTDGVRKSVDWSPLAWALGRRGQWERTRRSVSFDAAPALSGWLVKQVLAAKNERGWAASVS